MSKPGNVVHHFKRDTAWFMRQINSRKRVLPTFAYAGKMLTERAEKDLQKFVEKHTSEKTYDESGKLESYSIEEGFSRRHTLLKRAFEDFAIFSVSLPKMSLVSVVSLFDAYLARILKNVYKVKPEILNSCTREISFSELVSFGSIQKARDFIIDKEIETLLRDSHIAQFEWLEKKLGVPLTDLPSWKDFIELTERRNLLVHADGRVNSHYVETCKKFGIPLDAAIRPGVFLTMDGEYYENACNCVAEIGLKLGQVLWRKLLPDDLENAEETFIEVTYDLLLQQEYRLAELVLALSRAKAFKKLNAESGFYMTVNLAIALKGQKKSKECSDLLGSIDFSALASKFKIANLVLTEQYSEAASLMKKMGINEDLSEVNYRDWPLFHWFRQTDEFKNAYKEVFGTEFVIFEEAFFSDDDDEENQGDLPGKQAASEDSEEEKSEPSLSQDIVYREPHKPTFPAADDEVQAQELQGGAANTEPEDEPLAKPTT